MILIVDGASMSGDFYSVKIMFKTRLIQTLLVFTAVYLSVSIVVVLLAVKFDFDSNQQFLSIGILFVAGSYASKHFIKSNGRAPSVAEKAMLILGSMVAAILSSVLVSFGPIAYFIFIQYGLPEVMQMVNQVLGLSSSLSAQSALLLVTLRDLFLLYIIYGLMARMIEKRMISQNEI